MYEDQEPTYTRMVLPEQLPEKFKSFTDIDLYEKMNYLKAKSSNLSPNFFSPIEASPNVGSQSLPVDGVGSRSPNGGSSIGSPKSEETRLSQILNQKRESEKRLHKELSKSMFNFDDSWTNTRTFNDHPKE
jgi:hypothetical protein